MKWSINRKLLGGFLSLALLLTAVGGVSFYFLKKVDDSYSDIVGRRTKILVQVKDIQVNATELNNSLRDYLLTRNSESLKSLDETSRSLNELVSSTLLLVKSENDKKRKACDTRFPIPPAFSHRPYSTPI